VPDRPASPDGSLPVLRPHALAYVASVPREVLAQLASPRCWVAVGALVDVERRCEEQREHVSSVLHRAVAATPERDRRRALLRVRRELHRGHLAPDARAVCAGAAALPAADREALLAHCDGLAARGELETALERALDEELALVAGRLPAMAEAHEPLLAGVALVSPDLYHEAVKALAARSVSTAGSRPSGAELSVALYLVRAITKIAAYSTFTAAARTRWTDAGPAFGIVGDGLRQHRVVSVNHLPLTVLRLALTAPDGPDERPLAVNPYCSFEDARVRTVRLSDLVVRSRRCAFLKVDLVSIGCAPALGAALRAGHRLPAGLTRSLLDLQVLVPGDEHREDPQGDLTDELLAIVEGRPAAGGGLPPVAEGLRRSRRLARACGEMDAPGRAAAVEQVDRSIRDALGAAGVEARPEMLAPPVYERAELADAEVALSRPAWLPVLRDLALLERALPLWDIYEPLRPMAAGHFVDTFGAGGTCRDVLRFLVEGRGRERSGLRPDGLLDGALDWWLGSAAAGGSSDRERRFRRRRREMIDGLLAALARDPAEVEVDGGWLAELGTDAGPGVWSPVRCHAFSGHLCVDGSLVLNTATDGWGRRLAQHDGGRPAAGAGEPLVPAAPPGHEFVEVSGTFGFNANVHAPMTRRQLLMPGDGGAAGPPVRLTDLVLTHDAGADRLRLTHGREGVEIHPLYLGALAPPLLGPLHQAILPFTQVSWTDLPVAELAHRLADRPGAVGRYPRVRLGRLVLSRRKWIVPAELWPDWPPAHAMRAGFLRDLERWRRELGLPEQVFVRPIPAPGSRVRSWKPQFVDFRSVFVLAAVARRMRFDAGHVVVEEALPAPEEYAACWKDGRYASMVIVETQVPGPAT
jgi:hypothetical protein